MIHIYHRKTCGSSKRAMKWLDLCQLDYKAYSIESISKQELLRVLQLTDFGTHDLVKHRGDEYTLKKIEQMNVMSLDHALDYLQQSPEILRTPIIVSDTKLLIGYNDSEIRKFIPKSRRRVTLTTHII